MKFFLVQRNNLFWRIFGQMFDIIMLNLLYYILFHINSLFMRNHHLHLPLKYHKKLITKVSMVKNHLIFGISSETHLSQKMIYARIVKFWKCFYEFWLFLFKIGAELQNLFLSFFSTKLKDAESLIYVSRSIVVW